MELILILGPMKSGKSFDLINYFAPLRYTDVSFRLYQSQRNVRDEQITSRNGVMLEALKVPSLAAALEDNVDVIGVDEIHMFPPADATVVAELLKRGKKVVAAGLDTDYKGKLFDIIHGLLELGPKEVRYRRAACEVCKRLDATHTQVLECNQPVVTGLPPVIPDDGTFSYKPVCRTCFVSA